jgi:hypothetical protein
MCDRFLKKLGYKVCAGTADLQKQGEANSITQLTEALDAGVVDGTLQQ